MTALLDGNVLIALTLSEHTLHAPALRWLASRDEPFATTPITQGTLLRTMIRLGASSDEAIELLEQLTASRLHVFWFDDLAYSRQVLEQVSGHAAVTDAYLAALARKHGGRVATLDRRFAVLYPDAVDAIETN